LIEAEGQVVSKQVLLENLWPKVIVEDDTLARTVSRLRTALKDSASNPKYVETIPKKGYRFTALSKIDANPSIEQAVNPEVALASKLESLSACENLP
jgi:DNA-binding winged helix-turn-helix (wHTH) protein